MLFDPGNRSQWDRYALAGVDFEKTLDEGRGRERAAVGPLLTTAWHQGPPYNNDCPMGDGDRCVVGCVATATAQIMRYHQWPPYGTGEHEYDWDGDDSCGGSTSGATLTANYADSYAWSDMPDDCTGGCSPDQDAALAELCYEVGVAFEMDYGACGSGASTSFAQTVLPTYFRYDAAINREDRVDHTPSSWFALIQNEINAGRPILYRIFSHAIVCDGWSDDDGIDQFHMNYGWADSHTAWYAIDNLHCPWQGCDPDEEYAVLQIYPDASSMTLCVPADYATIQGAIDVAANGDIIEVADGTYTGAGNKNLDFGGKAITVRSASGDPALCIIDCEGSGRGFHFHSGETTSSVIAGFTLMNGHSSFRAGAVHVVNAGPTLLNCVFRDNEALAGGAVFDDGGSSLVVNCIFVYNYATADGGAFHTFNDSRASLVNCLFARNSAATGGGAIDHETNSDALLNIANCTFVGNGAVVHGGAIWGESSAATLAITNCVLWGNTAPMEAQIHGNASVTYCCIQDGWLGTGNIALAPQFLDPDGPDGDPQTLVDNDYRLAAGSPCIDAGSNLVVSADVADLDHDGDSAERTPLDLDGLPRFADDPGTIDSGVSDPPSYPWVVDMGAFEFAGTSGLVSDLDGDGDVDINDFNVLAGCMSGPLVTPAPDCDGADLDLDTDVDLTDFAVFQVQSGT
ncbi:MAG: C10 family peptidase [Phycisphaerae bacterium]